MKKKATSIKQIFSQANKLMLVLAIIPLLASILLYSRQIFAYQSTLKNIQSANNIAAKVDTVLLEELWDVVTGQVDGEKYQKQSIVDELSHDINEIQKNTETTAEDSILEVALRIINTLDTYQQAIIDNLALPNSYEKNVALMVQVDTNTQLLSDILQEFVRTEINVASQKNTQLISSLILITIVEVLIVVSIIHFVKRNYRSLNKQIEEPLNHLVDMANELAKGNLNYRLEIPETEEIAYLTRHFNQMADNLVEVLEENALKQYHLAQSEARVLQAQITPHFIYNSLDAIVSLIEQGRFDEAKTMTYSLSDFFRISLSKGKDWVPISTEIKHIHDYLIILKIRYGDMLDFHINLPSQLESHQILKMILQPLVENAVYHGTKFTRRIGIIEVSVSETTDSLIFKVQDNGKGMTPERLKEVQEELLHGIESTFSTGYGLYNVNKRLLLYYGTNASLTINSIHHKGTTVIVTVPKIQEDPQHV